jgi:hypothetical protein
MLIHYAYLKPWRETATEFLPSLLAGSKAGMISGDIEIAFINKNEYSYMGILCGLPLKEHCIRMRKIRKEFSGLGQETVMVYMKGVHQLGLNLIGKAADPLVLSGKNFDAEDALRMSTETNHASAISYILLLQLFLAVFMSDFHTGVDVARRIIQRGRNDTFGALELLYVQFLAALTEIIVARETGSRRNIRASLKSLKRLRGYVKGSLHNWTGRFDMVLAEYDAVQGKYDGAVRRFNCAIDFATNHGFIHEKALALERIGILLIHDLGRMESGIDFLFRARDAYSEWGCEAKCKRIEVTIAKLR